MSLFTSDRETFQRGLIEGIIDRLRTEDGSGDVTAETAGTLMKALGLTLAVVAAGDEETIKASIKHSIDALEEQINNAKGMGIVLRLMIRAEHDQKKEELNTAMKEAKDAVKN